MHVDGTISHLGHPGQNDYEPVWIPPNGSTIDQHFWTQLGVLALVTALTITLQGAWRENVRSLFLSIRMLATDCKVLFRRHR